MSGSLGSGKTLIARAMPGILPKLELSEAFNITCIVSVADMARDGQTQVKSFRKFPGLRRPDAYC